MRHFNPQVLLLLVLILALSRAGLIAANGLVAAARAAVWKAAAFL